jgi:MBG domain (YGX type)
LRNRRRLPTQGTLVASSNYTLTYVGANLTVTAAGLTVTASAQSRLYGAANPTLTYVSSGLVNGDTLSGLLATAATTTSNVGAYAITQGTLAATSNYTLTYVGGAAPSARGKNPGPRTRASLRAISFSSRMKPLLFGPC